MPSSPQHASHPGMANEAHPFDPNRKFVRVRELRGDGFVDFEFAVGDPETYVEMMLHADAFDEFCAMNQAIFLPPLSLGAVEADTWRLSQITDRQVF